MAFIFTCGTHNFRNLIKGYEQITVQCQNCGNFSGKLIKEWEWFTFCFIPIIPFSLKPWQAVNCHICRFTQDIKYRPDVQQQMNGGGQNIPLQGPPQGAPTGQPQGWNQGPPQGWDQGPPPQAPGGPQYK